MNLYELIHYCLVGLEHSFFFHSVKSVGKIIPPTSRALRNQPPPTNPPAERVPSYLKSKKKGVAPMFCPHYNLINDNYPLVN